MNWIVDKAMRTATTLEGFRITWAEHPKLKKPWFNAFAPSGKCIESGMDVEKCKAECERRISQCA